MYIHTYRYVKVLSYVYIYHYIHIVRDNPTSRYCIFNYDWIHINFLTLSHSVL